jgi:predicted Zn-dependent protease
MFLISSRIAGTLFLILGCIAAPCLAATTPADGPETVADSVLLDTMGRELARAMSSLGKTPTKDGAAAQPSPYFLSYDVADARQIQITAQYGAITNANQSHSRVADVQVRIGEPKLDNTHGQHRASALSSVALPLNDDQNAIERSLWWATDRGYGNALENYLQVKTESQVRAKEEDNSPDFSVQQPQKADGPPASPVNLDRKQWEQELRKLSAVFREYPDIYNDAVLLTLSNETDYYVSSEGSRVVEPHTLARIVVLASSRADDGMELFRAETFEAATPGNLPQEAALAAKIRAVADDLVKLRKAPVTEPFNGPAILSGRAAAVFFHEVLGHRLEGQRQRGDEEGQTFTKNLGKPILPRFLSVADDPTLETFNGIQLSGHYTYDDEGQPARRVDLIQSGVLKTFLMSRLPIASFAESNGHGRAQTGRMPTGRQGNLIVSSMKSVPDAKLRQMLIAEAKKQGKPYGLYFADISSGFAVTTRRSPQAFQVLPIIVYRVYVDGRPDELVRGVSIVGTPQTVLNRIAATGDKQDVFNGECGAESGSIPVSAIAPAMLVTEIETQRQPQGNSRPPILPPPAIEAKNNGGVQ